MIINAQCIMHNAQLSLWWFLIVNCALSIVHYYTPSPEITVLIV